MSEGMNRRRFLKVFGATGSGAVALSACSGDQAEKLIPYLVAPEDQVPGIATWYSSTCRGCSAGCGVHVRVREGRAVKVEGNPNSPINRGKLCSAGQAELQGLYNPDRVREPMARNASGEFEPISWDDAFARLADAVNAAGDGSVRFLTGNETGSFAVLADEWLAAAGSPDGRVTYEPFAYEALRYANNETFGRDEVPHYDFERAGYVLSFGADFLETWLSPIEMTRGFAHHHSYKEEGGMGRYVHVEPRMSMTAASADEWVAPRPGTEAALALAMAHEILAENLGDIPADARRLSGMLADHTTESAAETTGIDADTIHRLAVEFAAAPSVAIAGGMGSQHGEAHATAVAVNILNYVAGNVGDTVRFGAGQAAGYSGSFQDLADLVRDMNAGSVSVLMVHSSNPVYAASGLGFDQAMMQVPLKVSFSNMIDETSSACDLILPDHHPLEQWNDSRPRSGVFALQQPVMRPVFQTLQTGDILLTVANRVGGRLASSFTADTYKSYLEEQWESLRRQRRDSRNFETFWHDSVRDGGVFDDPSSTEVRLSATADNIAAPAASDGVTLMVYPSMNLFDGRHANKPLMQEVPDPVSKFSWSSWVEMSPHLAEEHDLHEGEYVELTTPHGSVTSQVFIHPGIRDDLVAMPAGQGHTDYGQFASDLGENAFSLLDPAPTAFGGRSHYASVTLRKTRDYDRPAKSSGKNRQMGRGIAQAATLAQITGEQEWHPYHPEHAAPIPEHIEHVLDEWQDAQWADHERGPNYAGENQTASWRTAGSNGNTARWGMAVDLSRCTGCSACITACYSENNIPTVGKEQIKNGREMTWIRIERYFEGGDHDQPLEMRMLPMMCQQCGNAPCEPVCPVFAAYHTPDGLNGQVYNRCVGTRYCANNCPYKVRYFNYFDHSNPTDPYFSWPEPLHLQLNPDVTMRSKGVMEKCTFCVQRIRDRQNRARVEGRLVEDGEIRTACQQTCPADAIVFGDMNDPNSRVSQMTNDNERGYHVLEGLNTYSGVTYLMKVRNVTDASAATEAH